MEGPERSIPTTRRPWRPIRPRIGRSFPQASFGEDEQTAYGDGWTGAKVVFAGHSGIDAATGAGRNEGRGNPWGPYEHLPPSQWGAGQKTSESYRRANTSGAWIGEALALRLMRAEKAWAHDAFFDYVDRWMYENDDAFVKTLQEAIKDAHNPCLVAEYWVETDEEAALLEKIRNMKVDLDHELETLADLEAFTAPFRQQKVLNMVLDGKVIDFNDWWEAVKIKGKGILLPIFLKAVAKSQKGIGFFTVRDTNVVIINTCKSAPGPERGMVEKFLEDGEAGELIRKLGGSSRSEWEGAEAELRKAGFSAEMALWDALDSAKPEVPERAEKLLKELYVPRKEE